MRIAYMPNAALSARQRSFVSAGNAFSTDSCLLGMDLLIINS